MEHRLDSYLDQQDKDAEEYIDWLYRWIGCDDSPPVYCKCGNRLTLSDLECDMDVCMECR